MVDLSYTRDRNPEEHFDSLRLREHPPFNNLINANVLIAGGGEAFVALALAACFYKGTKFTNLDLYPGEYSQDIKQAFANVGKNFQECCKRVQNIAGNFATSEIAPDNFLEVWTLYAMTVWAQSIDVLKLFWLRSAYAVKPGGVIRAYPVGSAYTDTLEMIMHLHRNYGFEDHSMGELEWTNATALLVAPKDKALVNKSIKQEIDKIMSTSSELGPIEVKLNEKIWKVGAAEKLVKAF